MNPLQAMRSFARALELGSLSAAARDLRTTQPTVSKQLAALEAGLGVRLLERSTVRLMPTEEGRRFYERAKRLLEDYEEAVDEARGRARQPAGLVRVNAPLALGECRLHALMQDFLDAHPDIEAELILNDRFVDLVEEGVDLAVRLGGPLPPQLVARRIGVSPRFLVATPEYVARHPCIRRPADLARHEYIRYAWSPAGDVVALDGPAGRVEVEVRGRYRVNSAVAILQAVLAGRGVALEPAWMVQEAIAAGRLVRVLPRWTGPAQEATLLYPPRRQQPLRLQVLVAFLSERLRALPGFFP